MKERHRHKNSASTSKKRPKKKKEKLSLETFDLGEGLTLRNPLTEGLGFKDKVSDGVYTSEMDKDEKFTSYGGVLNIGHENLDDGVLNIGEKGSVSVQSVDTAPPALFHSGHDGLIKRTAKKSGESFLGAVIDVLLLAAVTIFTAAAVAGFAVYKFDFELMSQGESTELFKIFLVFGTYFLAYKVLTRVFFGKTLGEWSSRHQLGLTLQQHDFTYPVRVLFRETVCLMTGVFLFPILSQIVKRDVGFYVSGLQTYIEQKKK